MAEVTQALLDAAIGRHDDLKSAPARESRYQQLEARYPPVILDITEVSDEKHVRGASALIRILSVLDYLAESLSDDNRKPVDHDEYLAALGKAIDWLMAISVQGEFARSSAIERWLSANDFKEHSMTWVWVASEIKRANVSSAGDRDIAFATTAYAIGDLMCQRMGH